MNFGTLKDIFTEKLIESILLIKKREKIYTKIF